MRDEMAIQINGRTYTAEDIEQGRHRNDPAITEADGRVINVSRGAVVGIQAGAIRGDITFS